MEKESLCILIYNSIFAGWNSVHYFFGSLRNLFGIFFFELLRSLCFCFSFHVFANGMKITRSHRNNHIIKSNKKKWNEIQMKIFVKLYACDGGRFKIKIAEDDGNLFVSVMFVLPDGTLWHKKNVQRHHWQKKGVPLCSVRTIYAFLFVDQFMNSDFMLRWENMKI